MAQFKAISEPGNDIFTFQYDESQCNEKSINCSWFPSINILE